MRLPRVRFTVRRMVVVVAIAGSTLAPGLLRAQAPPRLSEPVVPKFELENRGWVYFLGGEPPHRLSLADMRIDPQDAVWVTCLAYSPDGKTLAVGDGPSAPMCMFPPSPFVNENGGLIHLVETATNRVRMTLRPDKRPEHEYRVDRLEYSPDGRTLVSLGRDRTYVADEADDVVALTVWDVTTGQARSAFSRRLDSAWPVPAASPLGRSVAVAAKDGKVRVWNATQAEESFSVKANGPVAHAAGGGVSALVFSPDGRYLAIGYQDGDLGLWETTADREVVRFPGRALNGQRAPVFELMFGTEGRTLVCIRCLFAPANAGIKSRSAVTLYDVPERREGASLSGDNGVLFRGLAFSPNSTTLALGCYLATEGGDDWSSGWVRLWDRMTLKARDIGKGEVGGPRTLVFSPDGMLLAVTSEPFNYGGGKITLLDLATGKKLARLPSPGGFDSLELAFSPDGRTLASTGLRLKFWDLQGVATSRP